MDGPSYEDRQKRRFQPAEEEGSRYDAQQRMEHDEQMMQGEFRDSDYSSRSDRSDSDAELDRPWNPENQERFDNRPMSYQDLGSQSSSKRYRERDPHQDLKLGFRNSGDSSTWDDRQPSNQGFGSSYSTSSYGSRFSGGQQTSLNGNANRNSSGHVCEASYGRDDQGNFGSYSSSQNFGSNGNQGSRYGQSHGSQGPSPTHYGTQHSGSDFGQHYGTEQTLHGNDRFASNMSGRGPKGYKRSDERIREDVCDLLTSHPEVDPSEVDIRVSETEITLTGTVDSRMEKHLIEDLVSSVSGVTEVNNQLRIIEAKGSSHQLSSDHGSQASPSKRG